MNYQAMARALAVLFSLVWIVLVLMAFSVVGLSIRMLMNMSFLVSLLGALIIPIAVVWGLFIYFNK